MEACVETVFPSVDPNAVSLPEALVESPQAQQAPSCSVLPIPNIVHVGVDALFASVEQVLNPKLRGKPVLVGRGAAASASHEATLQGVKAGMTLREAMRICPKAIVVPGQYEHYAAYAERVRRILETYTPVVETAALDDFYLDFAGTEPIYPDFRGTLLRLQMDVFQQTGLSVSVAAAKTKIVAAIASRIERPRGFRLIAPGTEPAFLAPLRVEVLSGIGHTQAAMLANRGITTIAELRRVPRPVLEAAFGEVIGGQIWRHSRGRDSRDVTPPAAPKSISRETTIEGGTVDTEFLNGLIKYLCERVGSSLRDQKRQARSIGLRIRYVDHFSAYQTLRLGMSTSDEHALQKAARALFQQLFTRNVPVRLVGVTVSNLDQDRRQNQLFDEDGGR